MPGKQICAHTSIYTAIKTSKHKIKILNRVARISIRLIWRHWPLLWMEGAVAKSILNTHVCAQVESSTYIYNVRTYVRRIRT